MSFLKVDSPGPPPILSCSAARTQLYRCLSLGLKEESGFGDPREEEKGKSQQRRSVKRPCRTPRELCCRNAWRRWRQRCMYKVTSSPSLLFPLKCHFANSSSLLCDNPSRKLSPGVKKICQPKVPGGCKLSLR